MIPFALPSRGYLLNLNQVVTAMQIAGDDGQLDSLIVYMSNGAKITFVGTEALTVNAELMFVLEMYRAARAAAEPSSILIPTNESVM
ncbi:MAG: hypothetical protein KF736_09875 [Acidobacteria bacterium]|nr:hypothetical protein [Acidobacteriota bacterium]MCW5949835.1 hypothetical protein [Pyrinomonadaceae bacterium]